jgi:hypothetical protein
MHAELDGTCMSSSAFLLFYLTEPDGQRCERTHARRQSRGRPVRLCLCLCLPNSPKQQADVEPGPGREAADRALGAVTLCSLGSGAKSNGSREVCVCG